MSGEGHPRSAGGRGRSPVSRRRGRCKKGTLYGCTTLLEKLSIRWFTPQVTRVPKQEIVTLAALDKIQVPDFEYREPYMPRR
jgi:hypothetical protein